MLDLLGAEVTVRSDSVTPVGESVLARSFPLLKAFVNPPVAVVAVLQVSRGDKLIDLISQFSLGHDGGWLW